MSVFILMYLILFCSLKFSCAKATVVVPFCRPSRCVQMFQRIGPIGPFVIRKRSEFLKTLSSGVASFDSINMIMSVGFLLLTNSFVCFISDWERVESDCRRALELDRSSLKVKLRNHSLKLCFVA